MYKTVNVIRVSVVLNFNFEVKLIYSINMSVAFVQRGNRPPVNPAQIQKMLDENSHLIQTIQEYQSKGKANECVQYQQVLHRNLVYLASIADSNQNIQALLPVSSTFIMLIMCRANNFYSLCIHLKSYL